VASLPGELVRRRASHRRATPVSLSGAIPTDADATEAAAEMAAAKELAQADIFGLERRVEIELAPAALGALTLAWLHHRVMGAEA
jgi:hypothetical protein